ncbi:MAG: YdbH domain-containing protein [Gammaproteobacteria bacterium]
MKQGKRRLLFLLSLLVAGAVVLVLALPELMRAGIASRLGASGLTLERFEVARPGPGQTRIHSMHVAGEDGSRYEVDDLVASYSPGGLLDGRLDSITAARLLIRPSTRTQPLTEVLQALFGLMEQDLNSAIAVDRLRVDSIRFALGNGTQLEASLTLQKSERRVSAEMRFDTPDRPLLRFSQQEPGRWQLEVSNREEDAFATARFDRLQEQPFRFSLESDLARLRQWATLFGIPFPAHNAVTRGTLRLKPDFAGRQASFSISGTADGIDEPGLQIERAETSLEGMLRWQEDAPDILVAGTAELIMEQLQRPELRAGRLRFQADAEVVITPEGLTGSLQKEALVESEGFALESIESGRASILALAEQRFDWEQATGTWHFGAGRYDMRLDAGALPTFRLEDGDYQLIHEPWRYPLEGRTGFSLEGATGQAGNRTIRLQNLRHGLTGSVLWPAPAQALTLAFDLDIAADAMQAAELEATELSARGGLSLSQADTAIELAIDDNFRLHVAGLSGERLAVEQAQLTTGAPLSVLMTDDGMRLPPARALSLTLTAEGIASGAATAGKLSLALSGNGGNPEPGAPDFSGKAVLSATDIALGASRAGSLESLGGIALTHENGRPRLTLAPEFRARIERLEHHSLALEHVEVTAQEVQALSLSAQADSPLAGAGSYRIDHAAVTHPAFRLEPGSFTLAVDATAQAPAVGGRLAAQRHSLVVDGQALNFTDHEATFILTPGSLSIEGALALDNTASDIGYVLNQDLQSTKGELQIESKPQGVRALAEALRRLEIAIPRELQLLSGSASVTGKALWGSELESVSTSIRLRNTGGRYGEAWFSGLESRFDLDLFPDLAGRSRSFSIPVIDLGIPVSELKGRISLSRAAGKLPVITLSDLRARLFKGTLSARRVRLDLNRRSNSFSLDFRDVSLAEMVRLQQFEEVEASGSLDGTLPITIGPSGLRISKGKATADAPGGYIRYRPKDAGAALKSASSETEMLLKALDDYRYDELEAGVVYEPDGQLRLQLQMKGNSPGLHATRPLHLNLNLDQNILSLVESLRAVNGLNDRIDSAVKKHFKARNP